MDCWLLILTHQVPHFYFRTSLLISKQSTKHINLGSSPPKSRWKSVKICENPRCGLRFCLTFISWIFSQSKMAIQRKCIPIPKNLHFLYAPCCLFWLLGNLKENLPLPWLLWIQRGFLHVFKCDLLYAKTSISESSIRHKSPFPKKRSFGPVHMSKKSSSKSEEKKHSGTVLSW